MKKIQLQSRWYLWLLLLLPPIILTYLVTTRSVNVPFWDQWELVPIIKNMQEGHFYLHDFWQQHNEHRLLFPRLIMMGAAVFTDWNLRYEVVINIILGLTSFGVLLSLFFRTNQLLRQKASLVVGIILSMIWFSPVQQENWLWGWQIQWFVSVLGLVMVLYALMDAVEDKLTWPKVLFLASGGVIAQYSLGNGMLIWPLVIATLIYLRIEVKKIVVLAGTAVLTTGLYYFGYHSPPNTPSKLEVIHHPVAFVKYIFIYMGRPLSFLPKITPILGVLVVGLFVALTVWLFLKHKKRFEVALPWIALGCYGLLSGLITASSRINLGVGQAYSSRYTTISSLLLISVVMLVYMNLDELRKFVPGIFKPLVITVTCALIVLVGVNGAAGIKKMNDQHQYLSDIQQCTRHPSPYEVCLLSAYPNQYIVRERLNYLKQIHWGGY